MSTEWWKRTHSSSGLSPSSSDDLNASNHNSYSLCQLCRRSGMGADIPSVCLAKSKKVRAGFSCLHWFKASWKCESLSYEIYQRGEANKIKKPTPTSKFCWNAEGACTSFSVSLYDWYYIWLYWIKMLFKLAQTEWTTLNRFVWRSWSMLKGASISTSKNCLAHLCYDSGWTKEAGLERCTSKTVKQEIMLVVKSKFYETRIPAR